MAGFLDNLIFTPGTRLVSKQQGTLQHYQEVEPSAYPEFQEEANGAESLVSHKTEPGDHGTSQPHMCHPCGALITPPNPSGPEMSPLHGLCLVYSPVLCRGTMNQPIR